MEALRMETRKHAAKGGMRGNPLWQDQEGVQPGVLALAKECHSLQAFTPSEQGAEGHDQNIEQVVLLGPDNARVFSALEMVDDRRVQFGRHAMRSSAMSPVARSIAEASLQGWHHRN